MQLWNVNVQLCAYTSDIFWYRCFLIHYKQKYISDIVSLKYDYLFFLFYLGEFSTALLTDFNLLWNINMNTKVYIVLLIRWCHLNLQIFIYFNLSPDSTSSFPLPSFPSPTAAAMIKLESQYVAPPNNQATIPSYDILGLYWTPDKYSQNVHQQTECCPKLKSNSDNTQIKESPNYVFFFWYTVFNIRSKTTQNQWLLQNLHTQSCMKDFWWKTTYWLFWAIMIRTKFLIM